MRRTQLYLDEQLWTLLHTQARRRQTTVSELVREAVRLQYLGKQDERQIAMQDFIGIRKGRGERIDATDYVRRLRRSDRLSRLGG